MKLIMGILIMVLMTGCSQSMKTAFHNIVPDKAEPKVSPSNVPTVELPTAELPTVEIPAAVPSAVPSGVPSPVPSELAPSDIVYPQISFDNPMNPQRTIQYASVTPVSRGGSIKEFKINPALPQGLNINSQNGVIYGTALSVMEKMAYTVTASNDMGSVQTTIWIHVRDIAPSNLSYNPAFLKGTKGQAIQAILPGHQGGAVSFYMIQPELPQGLELNEQTGVISGTPAALSDAANYTVTASNDEGSTSALISIQVVDVAPRALTYPSAPFSFYQGEEVSQTTSTLPAIQGGPVVSYSISPALPLGLSLNGFNGMITGAGLVAWPKTTFTINATNSGGSTSVNVTIEMKGTRSQQLALGALHTCFQKSDHVYCSGDNSQGQLGISSRELTKRNTFAQVAGLGSGLELLESGSYHTCAIVSGQVNCWGLDSSGQAGGSSLPHAVALGGVAVSLAAGDEFTCAVTLNSGVNSVWCWGAAPFGRGAQPAQVSLSISNPLTLSAGARHLCVRNQTQMECFGENLSYQLGTEDAIDAGAHVIINYETNVIASGSEFNCTLQGANLACFGDSSRSQLGIQGLSGRYASAQGVTLHGVSGMALGADHACAVVGASLYCWGMNFSGQIGNGARFSVSETPEMVLGGVTAVGAGSSHTCAFRDDDVYCWGDNSQGQLGDASYRSSLSPKKVF